MIGADELTLSNEYGAVIIVRRGPLAEDSIKAYRAQIEKLNLSMKLPADEIRLAVSMAGGIR